VRSMTGYGVATAEARTARLSVEIRGVNHRFLDVKVALPREYAPFEREVRERVRALAHRGHVEVSVARVAMAARRRYTVAVRADLARAYVDAVRRLGRSLGLDGGVSLAEVLRLPDLLEVREAPPEPRSELPALRRALAAALRSFDAERRREGHHLLRDMQARTRRLRAAAVRMRRRRPQAAALLRRRIEERLAVAGGSALDPTRVAQEAAFLLERGDVTEELVRLEGHLAALSAAVGEPGTIGKRIEFLLQEIHRELNTVGSKAGDRTIAAIVLTAKGETEKLREQVQNVE